MIDKCPKNVSFTVGKAKLKYRVRYDALKLRRVICDKCGDWLGDSNDPYLLKFIANREHDCKPRESDDRP